MSWQSYVDDHLLNQGGITKACIIGQKGGLWASSAGFSLSKDEEAFMVKWDLEAFQASGVHAGGVKYMTLQATPEHIYGRKGQTSIALVKTKQAILIAEFEGGGGTLVIENLGDYLKSANY